MSFWNQYRLDVNVNHSKIFSGHKTHIMPPPRVYSHTDIDTRDLASNTMPLTLFPIRNDVARRALSRYRSVFSRDLLLNPEFDVTCQCSSVSPFGGWGQRPEKRFRTFDPIDPPPSRHPPCFRAVDFASHCCRYTDRPRFCTPKSRRFRTKTKQRLDETRAFQKQNIILKNCPNRMHTLV